MKPIMKQTKSRYISIVIFAVALAIIGVAIWGISRVPITPIPPTSPVSPVSPLKAEAIDGGTINPVTWPQFFGFRCCTNTLIIEWSGTGKGPITRTFETTPTVHLVFNAWLTNQAGNVILRQTLMTTPTISPFDIEPSGEYGRITYSWPYTFTNKVTEMAQIWLEINGEIIQLDFVDSNGQVSNFERVLYGLKTYYFPVLFKILS